MTNSNNPSVTLSGLPIVDVCYAHHFVITMHKMKELKISLLRFQLSFSSTVRLVLLLSFLLLYSSSSILTTEKEHTALAIINTFNATNNTTTTSPINASSVKPAITNHPPVANAGPNQIVNESTTVSLVGAGIDSDPNEMLSYLWRQTDGPAVKVIEALQILLL